jgi:hypothetical protein
MFSVFGFELMLERGTVVVEIDAVVREQIVKKARITEHPIESGALIADHVVILPKEYSLSGVLSDTPISIINPLYSVWESYEKRSLDMAKKLEDLFNEKKAFKIISNLGVLENFFFTQLTIEKNKPEYGVEFSANIREIKEVSGKIGKVGVIKVEEDTKKLIQKTKNAGTQEPVKSMLYVVKKALSK